MYVSAAVAARNKKPTQKRKQSKMQSVPVVALNVGSDEDTYSSIIIKSAGFTTDRVIKIETVYDTDENLVQLKFHNNKTIPRKVIQTIALTIPYHPHLTSIIINSGLRMESLYEISKFLPNSHITELTLDRTFLSEANYYTLLTETKMKHLSLAKCTINDAVVKTIADQLKNPCPASKVLSALNLSTNRITDVGAKYLADMLRTNRQLSYLNLAGNMITDEGGMTILDTLHEFPLQAQELLDGRTRYVAYLKKRNDLINTLIIELQTAKVDKDYKKKRSKKSKLDTQSGQHVFLEKRHIETGVDALIQERAEHFAESRLGLYNEPFSSNNTRTQHGVVHCFGNNTLCYLNLAYNSLTYASLKKLHEVLSAQMSLKRTPRGLIKVVIEGNLMPLACKEYEEIGQLLGDVRKQPEVVTKKKPLSSRSTVN